MVRLVTLGRLALYRPGDSEPAASVPWKALGLLAVLGAGGATSRDRLMALLWPESDTRRARGSLKQALHQLRQQFGARDIVRGTAILELDSSIIDCDIRQFRDALARDDWGAAVAAYTGPFLDGVDLRGGTELEHWIDTTRSALQAEWAGAVEALAESAERCGSWKEAIARWRQLMDAEPGDSRVTLRLMCALESAGDRAAALVVGEAHQRSLHDEWQLPPDPAIEALAAGLRSGARATPLLVPPLSRPEPAQATIVPGARKSGMRRRFVVGLAALLALTAVGGSRAFISRSEPASGDPDLLVVAPLYVPDRELAVWREGIPDLLVRKLDGAGPLRTVRGPVSLGDPEPGADRESAIKLRERLGAGLVLDGALVRNGADSVAFSGSLMIGAGTMVTDIAARDRIDRMDVLADSIVVHVLRALGRSRPIAAAPRISLGARSLPALREFLRGEQFHRREETDSALVHYHQAVLEDPGFAMAHRRLGQLIRSNPEAGAAFGSARLELARAVALNHGLAPRDSLLLVSDSFTLAARTSREPDDLLRNLFGSAGVLETAGARFPYDADIWAELGESRYHAPPPLGGSPGGALAAFERAVALDPGYAPAYWHTIELQLRMRRPDRAATYARAAARLGARASDGAVVLTALVLDSGLGASATRQALASASSRALIDVGLSHLSWASDSGEAAIAILGALAARRDPVAVAFYRDPGLRLRYVALALAFRGRLAEAAAALDQATNPAAVRFDQITDPFSTLAVLGAVPEEIARRTFAHAFDDTTAWGGSVAPGAFPRALQGVAWWHAHGDTISLKRFADRASAVAARGTTPEAKLRGRYYAAVVPAYLALARGDSAGARARLASAPDSLCVVLACMNEKLLLARLLAASGADRQAAQVLDRWSAPPPPTNSPLAVLAELERGQVAERLGDSARARRAYGFVAEVWRRADPSLAPYVEAARVGLKRVEES